MEFPWRSAAHPLWSALAIAVISLGSTALRLAPLGESLWIDELHTAWCALADLDEVAARAASGNQSPLFFWLEWLLVRMLGPHELALRLPSLIAGCLLPLAVYWLARRWTTVSVGLTAAAMVALDPLAIFYATEARPYALVQLLAVAHFGLTSQLLGNPAAGLRAAWIVLAAVIFHLHYTAGLLIAAEIVAYCLAQIFCRAEVAYRWPSAALDAILAAALMLPAFTTLRAIFARRSNWSDFVPQADLWQVFFWWPAAAGGFFLLAALIIARRPTKNALLVICWAAVPATLAWFATASDLARVFYPRYLVIVPPAAALLAAWCQEFTAWQWSKRLYAWLLIVASALIGGVPQRLMNGSNPIAPRNEDWRGALAWLGDQHARRPFPVLVASGLIEANHALQPPSDRLREYLLFPVNSLYPLEVHADEIAPVFFSSNTGLDQTIEMLTLHRGGAWLIVRGRKESALQLATAVVTRLGQTPSEGNIWRVTSDWSGGQVHVLSVEFSQP